MSVNIKQNGQLISIAGLNNQINDSSASANTTYSSNKIVDLLSNKADASSIPTKTSDLQNDSDFVADASYVHTDNNFTDSLKSKVDNLGTAATKDVATSGNASSSQVVMGNDTRLTDSRSASDVYDWAKASTKPTYTASEVGLGNVGNYKAVSTVANQGLTDTEKANSRANIGAGTSNFSGAYDDLSGKPTLGTASAKDVPTSGNASTTQVVMGNDTRLSDSRPASDVYSWAKAENKPTYNASEVGAIATTAKGTANGVAELDSTGKVPSAQLPSYVDDVIEGYYYNGKFYKESTHETEISGESGKIYVDLATDKTYRWSGTAFTQIKGDLTLGETSTTAYRGDRGKTAYDHSQTTSGNPHNVTKSDVGLGNVGNFKAVSTEASQGLTDTEKSNARTNIGAGTSSFSGSYNDLSDKPTIPTVNDGVLTIQKNGTDVATFSANQSSNATANIQVVEPDSTIKTNTTGQFNTITGGKLESCDVKLEPIQDLHGYDKPWVGGAGKNKLSIPSSFTTETKSGITYTVYRNPDGEVAKIKVSGTATAASRKAVQLTDTRFLPSGVTYTLNGWNVTSITPNKNVNFAILTEAGAQGVLRASQMSVNFTIPASPIFIEFAIFVESGAQVDAEIYPMVRLSTVSDATFEPYSNICPITGHSSVEVDVNNKNYLPLPTAETNNGVTLTHNADGSLTITGTATANTYFDFISNFDSSRFSGYTLYLISEYTGWSNSTVRARVASQGYSTTYQNLGANSSINDNGSGLALTLRVGNGFAIPTGGINIKPMLVKNAEESPVFVPYNGTDYTTPLSATVYGGNIDVVSGSGKGKYIDIDLSAQTWNYNSSSDRKWFTCTVSDVKATPNYKIADMYCTCYKPLTRNDIIADTSADSLVAINTAKNIIIRDLRFTDPTDLVNALSGMHLIAERDTYADISCTPQQINTLIGENHLDVPLEGQSLDSAVYRELFAWDDVEDIVSERVAKSDIVDNLTTNDATKVLSAKQGKVLQDTKVNISDIKDNLTSTDTNKPLSAKQGKVLDEKIDGLYTEVTDNESYTLRQGKGDMVDMELIGGSFAWNQLVQNGNFASTSGWNTTSTSSFTVSNNEATFTATAQWGRIDQIINFDASHIILLMANLKGSTKHYLNIDGTLKYLTTANVYQNLYIIKKNLTYKTVTIGDSSTSDFSTCNVKNVQVFDLTQMFGTTIADYIYNLEQATSGSGVAFFRKYFPKDYYAYDTGSIQSVNVASRKVVGKNLLNLKLSKLKASNTSGTWSGNTYTFRNATFAVNTKANGEDVESITISSTASSSVGYLAVSTNTNPSDCVVGGKYIISSDNSDINVSYYNGSDIEGGDTSSLEFVYNPSTIYWNIIIRASSQTISNKIARPMIRDARITDATYAPYKDSISYPFDTTKQLRGIPSLVNNKLVYNGDVLKSDGSVTRKYGIVDLGSLNWTYHPARSGSYSDYFDTYITGIKNGISTVASKLITLKYTSIPSQNIALSGYDNNVMAVASNSTRFIVCDKSYTDATTFKTAMNGVYLVYELATPTTESAEPYQNPQRSDASGTEEFVDYGVESSTRDVSIPVGHNSTYKSSEVIHPLEDYVDGAIETIPVVSKSANGLCPQLPNETATTKFLRQDGTWAEPSSGGSIAYSTTKTAVGTWIDGRTIYKQTFEETITGNGDLTITVGSKIDFVIDGSAVLVQDYDYQFGQMTVHSYTVNNCDLTEMPTTYSYPTFHCKGTTKTKVGSSSSYKILMNIASYPTDQSASNINSKLYLTVTFVEYAS